MNSDRPTHDRIGAIRPDERTARGTTADSGVHGGHDRGFDTGAHSARERHHDDLRSADARSTGALLRDLRDQTTTLLRQELALARTEVREKVSMVGRNVAYFGIGALIACLGLVFLLLAVTSLLAAGLVAAGVDEATAAWLSPLLVGLVIAGIGYALVRKATTTLGGAESYYPNRTVNSMKENAQWIGEKTT